MPDFAVIEVQKAHIPTGLHSKLTLHEFSRPAFGSRFIPDAQLITDAESNAKDYQVQVTLASDDLTRLSLFDLWLSNNDRNWNNYNLLLSGQPSPSFIPIDHEKMFDHGLPGSTMALQTQNENLASTSVFEKFVSKKYLKGYLGDKQSKEKFNELALMCKHKLPKIWETMPSEWRRTCPDLISSCNDSIFAEDWLKKVWSEHMIILKTKLL